MILLRGGDGNSAFAGASKMRREFLYKLNI